MFTKSIAAIVSLFSFGVFFNSQEACAFSPAVKQTTNAAFATHATSTSRLAAAVNGHSQSCSCDSCRGTHGAACSCPACSRTQHKTHGAACGCPACSRTQTHKAGCSCSSCSGGSHGPACGCSSCQE
jgi:hypothetical protein